MQGEETKPIDEIERCPKCGCERWKREELAMYGKARYDHWFIVTVCEDCHYSQLFYSRRGGRYI